MFNPLFAWAIDDPDPNVAAIVASIIGVNTHNHIDIDISSTSEVAAQ